MQNVTGIKNSLQKRTEERIVISEYMYKYNSHHEFRKMDWTIETYVKNYIIKFNFDLSLWLCRRPLKWYLIHPIVDIVCQYILKYSHTTASINVLRVLPSHLIERASFSIANGWAIQGFGAQSSIKREW